ncbi:MAG: formylglycine-generating enzyme family protein, partial [Anaerolineae bacterium]|nr:formylglycine-generating enzyme family protein [Anaerolineae bacterium]
MRRFFACLLLLLINAACQPRDCARAGQQRVSEQDGMVQMCVPAGEFISGEKGETQTRIYLDAFWMDRTEVTNAMFARCVEAGVCHPRTYSPYLWGVKSNTRPDYFSNPVYAEYPVIMLEGGDADAYCQWVGRRLPEGLEWEKAARGEDGRTYPWGEDINCERANYGTCSDDTASADSYPEGASPYGILNMAGNLEEWTAEWYNPQDGSAMTEAEAGA